jgi:hypothetical protein
MQRVALMSFALTIGVAALAQSPCPTQVLQGSSATSSSDLLCMIPQQYGAGGLVGSDNGGPLNSTINKGHEAHFQASSVSDFRPINAEIGLQLSQVPLAAPVAGVTFQNGVWQEAVGLGPVLADRAETIGRHTVFLGFNYEYFDFDKADNINLRNFGAVFTHEFEACPGDPNVTGVPCFTNSSGQSVPVYTQDVIATQNKLNLMVNQYSIVATFGLNSKWDASLAVPIVQVRLNMTSNATIYNFEPPPVDHSFASNPSDPGETYIGPSNAIFNNHRSAMGVGDIRLRNKFVVWQSDNEKSSIAAGLDVRFPTGDAYNFLGSGTWGVRPFFIFSHASRVSPHMGAGFEGNGQSILAGDVTTKPIVKDHLADVLSYNAGIDTSLPNLRWLGLSADFLGNSLMNTSRIKGVTTTDYAGNIHPDMSPSVSTVNEEAVSLGAKIRAKKLLIVGNCLIRVNNAGLHYKPSPLIGVSYTF